MERLEQLLVVTTHLDLLLSPIMVSVIHKVPESTANRGLPTSKGDNSFRLLEASVRLQDPVSTVRSRPGWS